MHRDNVRAQLESVKGQMVEVERDRDGFYHSASGLQQALDQTCHENERLKHGAL